MASEYLKWKYRDVKPDEPIQYTAAEKRRNWWHYHKWHVIIAAVLLLAAGNILYHVLGVGEVKPDYQIAYVGDGPLPDDTVKALESTIAALGQDCNSDGRVTVTLHQYVSGANSEDENGLYHAYAASVTLMADITECDSYFFLLDDPDGFQRDHQVLRRLDGTLPSDIDRDYESCYLAWSGCPVLTALDLGDYTEKLLDREISGSSQELMSGLYIARRGFWTDETTDYPDDCDRLWNELTKGALS